MVQSDFKFFENAIIKVYNEKGEEIRYKKLEIKNFCSKYSSSHKIKPSLFLDDNFISSKKKYKVMYKCSCGAINTILLYKYLLKERLRCGSCREDEDKRIYDFASETDEFKRQFYETNLTMEEFNEIRPFLFSVYGLELKNDNFSFLEHENGVNAKKYRQMMIIDSKKVPFKNIIMKCPLCGKKFSITRPIKNRARIKNFLCKECCFNNKVFCIKNYKGILYQSNFELEFIKACEQRNIKVLNGHIVKYGFNGSVHDYKIDFYLPEFQYQIELKDNHVWHKKQVESGKWKAKEEAALKFCKKNNMSFYLLFPNDINAFLELLERDSLTISES